MKINWRVRFRNPHFWIQVILAAVMPVLGYFGLTASDMTTWTKVLDTFLKAVSSPYVLLTAAISVYNAVVDPTTSGIGDSPRALCYQKPAKQKEETKDDPA